MSKVFEACSVAHGVRQELILAEFGAVSLCSGFGPAIDSEITPQNLERWEGEVTGCQDQNPDCNEECLVYSAFHKIKAQHNG